ncbi:HORMA domain-containing protein 1 [Parelaphostrongylus tenuis]|uniref:HORMA domain-containing protein 1 n=1 Tax=Parelaphostrongylus tenuis TaxID=148309 RepID=A0AAD5QD80_PARTN|nr:HORMA domain-containing protein 1 [Parelaphostrongylus tenuis]
MDSTDVLGARMAQKFRGVTEAIDRQYLRELILVVSSTIENVTDVIEMYTWRMRYEVDGGPQAELLQADGTVMVALTFRGMQYLKKQTAELLNSLRTLCRELLKPLPPGASAFIRITYTDRTPKGYQAPGFYRFPDDPILRPDAQEVQLALLQTKYHGASLKVQSICIDDAYTVKCCLKEKVKPSDDSLNESLDGEAGAGDDAQHPSNNDTIERISGTSVQQSDAIEIAREDAMVLDETRNRFIAWSFGFRVKQINCIECGSRSRICSKPG